MKEFTALGTTTEEPTASRMASSDVFDELYQHAAVTASRELSEIAEQDMRCAF